MKTYKYKIIQLLVCCLVFTGCDKYLDITPKGKRLLSTVDDYDQWLNSEALINSAGGSFGIINYFADNVDVVSIKTPPIDEAELIYTWAPQFQFNLSAPPLFWGEHYAKINLFNTVLIGIDEATGGTGSKKRSLKAEALLGRALEYFYLVNEYAKPYDPATADQDLAVPFVTSNDITQQTPPRSTTAVIYKHIMDDLNAAIPDLPTDNSANRFRGSAAAAYSVLARLHFFARNYTEAQKNAELALANTRAVMINYNTGFPATNILSTHADVIYGRMAAAQAPPALEFMRTFAANDIRVRAFYKSTDNYTFVTRGATSYFPNERTPVMVYANTGTSVQEMKLIVAECAARANNLTLALQHLDEVRKNRITTASYVAFTSTDQAEVLAEVLKERSHELPFNGLRWFDMRRLNKEGKMGTVIRYDNTGKEIARLEPSSDRYTLQIPIQVMSYNPGMQQNP